MLEAIIDDIQIQLLKGGREMKLPNARLAVAGLQTKDGKLCDHMDFVVTKKQDEHGDHNFLTLRAGKKPKDNLFVNGTPKLAFIKPQVNDGVLRYHFEADAIDVPFFGEEDTKDEVPVQLWEYRGKARRLSRFHDQFLSDHVGMDVMMVRANGPNWTRRARQNYEPNDKDIRAQDGYQVHAVTVEDTEAVNNAIGAKPDANRFRYQVLLRGLPFRAIHDFRTLFINGAEIHQPKPCGRCDVPGIDYLQGKYSPVKPLVGLDRLGVGKWIDKGGEKQTIFGENWLPIAETDLQVGDRVVFTEKREPLRYE